MADMYISINASGQLVEIEATVTSAGAGNAGDIVALDGSGRLDSSVLPTGVGIDSKSYEFTESASAGDLVNIFDDGGTAKVRLADNTNGRPAHGFAPSAVTASATGSVYFEGELGGQTGLTPGATQFLDAAGAITETPTTTTGELLQAVGTARDATTVDFEPARPITRA